MAHMASILTEASRSDLANWLTWKSEVTTSRRSKWMRHGFGAGDSPPDRPINVHKEVRALYEYQLEHFQIIYWVIYRDRLMGWYSVERGFYFPDAMFWHLGFRLYYRFIRENLPDRLHNHGVGPLSLGVVARHPRNRYNKRRNNMVMTMGQMRTAAREQGVETIKSWEDPRLVDLIDGLHKHAEGKNYCATFDEISRELGLPPRPKKEYFNITRTGEVEFGGQTYPVEAQVEVYGEQGDEDGAIADYLARYGEAFEVALQRSLQKSAMTAITNSLTVKIAEAKPVVVQTGKK
jgi:hypothetical protein